MNDEAVRPSRAVLQDVTRMGEMLASTDPSLRPMLGDAHHYSSYVQFIMAHRHALSQFPSMASWEARLQKIIEIEAKHSGLRVENPTDWDRIERDLSVPLHCAFWYGWEKAQDLWQKYEKAVWEKRRELGASAPVVSPEVSVDVQPGADADDAPDASLVGSPGLAASPGQTTTG